MCCFIPSISIPRCTSSSLCLHSSYFRRKYMDVNIRRSFLIPSNAFRVYKTPFSRISFSEQIGGLHPLNLAAFKVPKICWNTRNTSLTASGIWFGLWLVILSSGAVNAKAFMGNNVDIGHKSSSVSPSHGKEVHADYSITGIPGDGRCLFRAVIHGACIQAGKSIPTETLQRALADELRSLVADEFIKRREETEWFIEGNFDDYVSHIRRPHVWGGEPELHMASHVLRMPITVYIYDEEANGAIAIAEYGQEYGKEDPIQVFYDGSGHYDALQIRRKAAT